MYKREREDEEKEYFPIFKKAKKTNIVGRVLQQLDTNVPKATTEPKNAIFLSQKSSAKPNVASDPLDSNEAISIVLHSLGSSVGVGEKIKHLLPLSQKNKKNCDMVAAFAMFLEERQNVLVKRIQMEKAPFTENKVLTEFFFTNIYREADPGTKYFRQQMLDQHPEIGPDQLATILCQTVLYRVVNKRPTFEAFGKIPDQSEWKKFEGFMRSEMKKVETIRNHPKPFTAAHQINGMERLILTMKDVIQNREKLARRLKRAINLQQCFDVIKTIPYCGPFFSWQITADLLELKLIKFPENWTELGPGAKNGLKQIFNVKSEHDCLRLSKNLTSIMPSVFNCLGIEFKFLLGKRMSLKTIEHALCEFDKYARAATSGKSKRTYKRKTVVQNQEAECCLCEATEPTYRVDKLWWLCSRCFSMESEGIGNVTEVNLETGLVKLKTFAIKLENKKEKMEEAVNTENIKREIVDDLKEEKVDIKTENIE